MTWLAYHRQSEGYALKAHAALREGDADTAKQAFAEAARLEELALNHVGPDKPRTYGATAVSAASLWYKAHEFAEAARVAHVQLANPGLPNSAREQLDDLLITLYNERDKARLNGTFLPGSVMVSVKGGDVLRGAAPLDLIVDRVKNIQSLFYRVIEWKEKRTHRRSGPPPKDLTNLFEPWLLQEPAGSFQFSVAVKTTTQIELFDSAHPATTEVAQAFLEIVRTIGTDETGDATKDLIPEDDYRSTFRKLVRNLTPTGNQFDALNIAGKDLDVEPLVLDAATRPRLAKVLKDEQPKPNVASGEKLVELTGILRGLDLDKDWLRVDTGEQEEIVRGLSQAVDDVIGPMVNKRVVIKALKKAVGHLTFVDIEFAA